SRWAEDFFDDVGGSIADVQPSAVLTVTVTPGTAQANWEQNYGGEATIMGRGYSMSPSRTLSVAVQGPSLGPPAFGALGVAPPGSPLPLVGAGQGAIRQQLASLGLPLSPTRTGLPMLTTFGVGVLPQPQRSVPATYGNWLGRH